MPRKTKSDELARAEEALKRAEEARATAKKEREEAELAYKTANERFWAANDVALKAHAVVAIAKMSPLTVKALRALNKSKDGRIDVPSYTKFWEGPSVQSLEALARMGLATAGRGYKPRDFVITPAGVDWCNAHPEDE